MCDRLVEKAVENETLGRMVVLYKTAEMSPEVVAVGKSCKVKEVLSYQGRSLVGFADPRPRVTDIPVIIKLEETKRCSW